MARWGLQETASAGGAGDESGMVTAAGFGDEQQAPGQGRRPPRRGRRILAVTVLMLLVLIGSVAGALFVLTENIGNNVERIPNVFGSLDDSARPAAGDARTFLLVGTDSRSTEPTTGSDATAPAFVPGAQRSDVLMLARVNPARTEAAVVSIPRDSWVEIPGRGPDKVNAAYSFGGPSLLVGTVEALTGIHVDHFAVIDFAGFRSMVDAVGGIDVGIAAPTSTDGVELRQGVNHLDGEQALTYVRQRHGLPRGDLDRAKRQQNALRALVTRVASSGTLSDPVGLYDFLDSTSRSVGVDDTLTNGGLRSLALELRGLRPHNVTFLGAPVRGLGREDAQSVVYLDDARASELWQAVRGENPGSYAARYPADLLEAAPP